MNPVPALAALLALAACSGEKPAPPPAKALSCEASLTGAVTAGGAFVREQKDAGAMSAAYFTLCNGAMAPVTLTGLSTPVADIAEFHQSTRDDAGIVSMAPLGAIVLAPGERVVFEPGGRHVMLIGLRGPISSGDHAELTLHFAGGGAIAVDVVAKSNVEAAMGEHEGH